MQKYLEKFILFLIIVNVIYVVCGVIFYHLQSTDSIGIWFLKAKAIYLGRDYLTEVLYTSRYNYSHQQYPLLVPLFFSLIYQIMSGVRENAALMVYPLTYILILIFVYKTLILKTNRFGSLLFTYFYSMISPLVAGGGRVLGGNADIFLVLILWIIIYLLYSKNKYSLYLITILIMIASQVKLEGVFLSILILFLPISVKKRIIFFTVSVIPFLIWEIFIKHYGIPSDQHYEILGLKIIFQDLIIIFREIIKEVMNINNWYIYSLIIFLLIFTKEKTSKIFRNILAPFLFISVALYLTIYLTINTDTYREVSSSFDRVLFQLSPVIFIFFFEKMNYLLIRYRILKLK